MSAQLIKQTSLSCPSRCGTAAVAGLAMRWSAAVDMR
jgi:hypothetical protein